VTSRPVSLCVFRAGLDQVEEGEEEGMVRLRGMVRLLRMVRLRGIKSRINGV
jgi:hypothetical protein